MGGWELGLGGLVELHCTALDLFRSSMKICIRFLWRGMTSGFDLFIYCSIHIKMAHSNQNDDV